MKIDLENDVRLYFPLRDVAQHFDVNESLLRYWEAEFDSINPRKTPGGTRQYTKEDIEDIAVVYNLVKEKGMTLDGARQILKTKKDEETRKIQVIHKLQSIRNELKALEDEFED